MNRRNVLATAALCAARGLFATGTLQARAAEAAAAEAAPLPVRALAEGVFVVEGANADFSPANACNIINTAFIATGDGVLVINTGPSLQHGRALRASIERSTGEPVRQVIHQNLHPDYFLGNQAFADVPRAATALTRDGMRREAAAYEANLYRLCGAAMAGTQALLPDHTLIPGPLRVGRRTFELIELDGHTASDLVIVDRAGGIVFAGGLVFRDRIPTTPHADLPHWLASLDHLDTIVARDAAVLPSHGPVHVDRAAIAQTRGYLRWLETHLRQAAAGGLDIAELLQQGLPEPYRHWAAADTEYARNLSHLYPRYESAALGKMGSESISVAPASPKAQRAAGN